MLLLGAHLLNLYSFEMAGLMLRIMPSLNVLHLWHFIYQAVMWILRLNHSIIAQISQQYIWLRQVKANKSLKILLLMDVHHLQMFIIVNQNHTKMIMLQFLHSIMKHLNLLLGIMVITVMLLVKITWNLHIILRQKNTQSPV